MKQSHKIWFLIAFTLAIVSWLVVLTYWDKLPGIIPVHFDIAGRADGWAEKSIFYVTMIPVIQTVMLAVFTFVYYKPQYSNIPTTMWLNVLDKKAKKSAFDLIRTMNVGVMLWIGALFTYLTYAMNESALKVSLGLNPWLFLTLIVGMLTWITFWSVVIYKETKKAVKSFEKGGK